MKALPLSLLVLGLIQAASCVTAQDQAQANYARLVKPDARPEENRFHPDYPSEKEVLVGLLPRVVTDLNPSGYWVRQRPYIANGLLERPVVVTAFDLRQTPDRVLYYYCVPLVHPQWGVVDVYTFGRSYDSRKAAFGFDLGMSGGIGGAPGRPLHMMRAQEAKQVAEQQLGVPFPGMPMAVNVGVSNLQTREKSNTDWFWYLRSEKGFAWEDMTIHSVFVSPFCLVADSNNVTMKERAQDPRDIANVFIRSRFYTYEGEDIDLYALDAAQRKAGDAPLSAVKADALYLPERINFLPISRQANVEARD